MIDPQYPPHAMSAKQWEKLKQQSQQNNKGDSK